MKNKRLLGVMAFLIAVSIFFIGCKVAEEEVAETAEEVVDTGALVVESSPNLANVYIGEEYRGDTPLTLYNIPVGQYDIIIKKEGYADFGKAVTVKAGRTEEIKVVLIPVAPAEGAFEEERPAEEAMPENVSAPKLNKIGLSAFAMYYNFDGGQFTEIRTSESDLFSRKYDTYVHFTALTPAKIFVLNKPVADVKKEDCIFGDEAVAPLFSGQTLCVKTSEGSVAAIGGSWQTSPTELEWVLFG